jgi:hypothetical protein
MAMELYVWVKGEKQQKEKQGGLIATVSGDTRKISI